MTHRITSKNKAGSRRILTADFLAERAYVAFKKYRQSGRKKYLHCAVELATGADRRTFTPPPSRLRQLAGYLYSRHEKMKRLSDLDTAIVVAQRGIAASKNDRCEKALLLNTLSAVHMSRYLRRRISADLRRAVQAAKKAVVTLLRHDSREMPNLLNTLASAYQHFYTHAGKSWMLDAAIRAVQTAALCSTPLDPMRPQLLYRCSLLLKRRYMLKGEVIDLEQAIWIAKRATHCLADGHSLKPELLNTLGAHLHAYYELKNSAFALEKAVQCGKRAVELAPSGSLRKAAHLGNLSASLVSRHRLNGNANDLELAVRISAAAVQAIPKGHEHETEIRHNLAERQADVYRWTKNVIYLDLAVEGMRKSLSSTPKDHHAYASRHGDLAALLSLQFEKTGMLEPVNDAIKLLELSVLATPAPHPDRYIYLSNLGSTYASLYDATNSMAHLKHALELTQEAAERVPTSSVHYPTIVGELGAIFERSYARTGRRSDLEKAIQLATDAVNSCPDNTVEKAGGLCNLGFLLETQYFCTGAMSDLDEAIAKTREALRRTPRGHADLPGTLNNLAIKLQVHHARTEIEDTIDEAISHASRAVEQTASDHLDWAIYASNLAAMLQSRYEHSLDKKPCHEKAEQQEDLTKAVAYQRRAYAAMPQGHEMRMECQKRLGVCLATLYQVTSNEKDLSEAVHLITEAANSAPSNSLLQVTRKNVLASLLEMCYNRAKGSDKREEILSIALDVWNCAAAVPFERVEAGYRSLRMFAEELQTEAQIDDEVCIAANFRPMTLNQALPVAFSVLDLLPDVHARYLDRKDQQFVISMFSGVASLAAHLCLKAGMVTEAVECLERGRTVIINQLLNDREDLSSLSRTHPILATRYVQLITELNVKLPPSSSSGSFIVRRKEAAKELDTCIAEIRATCGSDFLNLTQSMPSMRKILGTRHVILVNVTKFGSHAIIVSKDTLIPLPLPKLTASETREQFDRNWIQKSPDKQGEKNGQLLKALEWLWNTCVGPVLLKISPTPDAMEENLPRVWWIGTGLASSLPFHAAGIHVKGSTSNAFSRAISSYTPSIMSLTHAIQKDIKRKFLEKGKGRLLLATMHSTPPGDGSYDALEVDEETDSVLRSAGSRMEVEVLEHPSVEKVSEALKTCSIAHFACHGKVDRRDPSNTALILQRGGGDGTLKQDPLSVQKILELELEHAHIAYLSACSTAENRAESLTDEVIHLASGFLVAGFPHVIGSLWRARDPECVKLAAAFYAEAFYERSGATEDVAMALHRAIQRLRTAQLDKPADWAQFVHWGV